MYSQGPGKGTDWWNCFIFSPGQGQGQVRKGHQTQNFQMCRLTHVLWSILDKELDSHGYFTIWLNLRPAGGVFEHPPPCGFSRIARKRRRAAPPGFHLPYPPSFWQLLWKFRSWVMQGQVTRSGQVTIPYKNFTIAPQLQCLRESYETFGMW